MLYARTVHPVMSSRTDAGSREQLWWLLRQSFWVCCLHGQKQQSRKEFLSHRGRTDLLSVPLSSFFKMEVILLFSFLFKSLAFWGKGHFSLFMFTTLYSMWTLICCAFCYAYMNDLVQRASNYSVTGTTDMLFNTAFAILKPTAY